MIDFSALASGSFRALIAPILLALLAAPVPADLPDSLALPVEGALLARASLQEGFELGIYGPRPARTGEPAIITALLLGNQTATISSGLILMAYAEDAVSLKESPAPAGSYIPFGQWSPRRHSEWRQLLILGPQALWALRVVPLAHPYFEAGPGSLFGATLFAPDLHCPQTGSALRDHDRHDVLGIAFIVDESIAAPREAPAAPAQTPAANQGAKQRPAHGLKFSFPLVLKDPAATLEFWLAIRHNGKFISCTLPVPIAPVGDTPGQARPTTGAPILDEPKDNASIDGPLAVSGTTNPGALAVAWLEAYDRADPKNRIQGRPVRHITDALGYFQMALPPLQNIPASWPALVYELHVRTEAPGYTSPETVLTLQLPDHF